MVGTSFRKHPRGIYHVIVDQIVEGHSFAIPVLHLSHPAWPVDVTEPVSRFALFCAERSSRSLTWMRNGARALGALWDYLIVRGASLTATAHSAQLGAHIEAIILNQFLNHFLNGTLVERNGELVDDTNLHWGPLTVENFRTMIATLADYTSTLIDTDARSSPAPTPSNFVLPVGAASLNAFIWQARFKQEFSFADAGKETAYSRKPTNSIQVLFRPDMSREGQEVYAFPANYIPQLIQIGFGNGEADLPVSIEDEHLGPRFMTAALALGGIRPSEALQFWVNDVQFVDGRLVMLLHHPQYAVVEDPAHGSMRRDEYLQKICGIVPRNRAPGKAHAGWKSVTTNNQHWSVVYWLPQDGVQELIVSLAARYLRHVRPRLMAERKALGGRDHPFLFVSSTRASSQGSESMIGDPYTLSAYRSAWRSALARLQKIYGDDRLEISKRNGTTPYGLRHFYGNTLADMNIPPEIRQRCMHQKDIRSQRIYTRLRADQINQKMQEYKSGSLVEDTATQRISEFENFAGRVVPRRRR